MDDQCVVIEEDEVEGNIVEVEVNVNLKKLKTIKICSHGGSLSGFEFLNVNLI